MSKNAHNGKILYMQKFNVVKYVSLPSVSIMSWESSIKSFTRQKCVEKFETHKISKCIGNILEFIVAKICRSWRLSDHDGLLCSNKSNRNILEALWTQWFLILNKCCSLIFYSLVLNLKHLYLMKCQNRSDCILNKAWGPKECLNGFIFAWSARMLQKVQEQSGRTT